MFRSGVAASYGAYCGPRQGEHRKLAKDDHETLIEALHTLTDVAEVHVSQLKQMDPKTRLELLSRASVRVPITLKLLNLSLTKRVVIRSSCLSMMKS